MRVIWECEYVNYKKYFFTAKSEAGNTEDKAAEDAAELVGGGEGLEGGFVGFVDNVFAKETDERDFVAVEDPDQAEGEDHEEVPAGERQAVEAVQDLFTLGLGLPRRRGSIIVVCMSGHSLEEYGVMQKEFSDFNLVRI